MTQLLPRPAEGWLLVRRELASEVTPGGLIKPPSALESEMGLDGHQLPVATVVANPGSGYVVGVYPEAAAAITYPEVGDKVVLYLKGGDFVAYWDENNPPVRSGRRMDAPLYFVQLSSVCGVLAQNAATSGDEGV